MAIRREKGKYLVDVNFSSGKRARVHVQNFFIAQIVDQMLSEFKDLQRIRKRLKDYLFDDFLLDEEALIVRNAYSRKVQSLSKIERQQLWDIFRRVTKRQKAILSSREKKPDISGQKPVYDL